MSAFRWGKVHHFSDKTKLLILQGISKANVCRVSWRYLYIIDWCSNQLDQLLKTIYVKQYQCLSASFHKVPVVMPFPETSRVKYQINPLVEVCCQWTFDQKTKASLSKLDAGIAAEIHASVRDIFPQFNIAKKIRLEINPELGKASQIEEDQFEFRSADSSIKLDLNKDGVALTASVYPGWESFREHLLLVVNNGISQQFGQLGISRIGLRYKDIVQRSSIGLQDKSWSVLVNPCFLNLHNASDGISDQLVGEHNTAVFDLPNSEGRLNVTYGLVTNSTSGEQCYLIDSDFYLEGVLDGNGAREYMDKYNVKSRNFFRWSISDTLHRALGPVSV